jgi:hypothetical protein
MGVEERRIALPHRSRAALERLARAANVHALKSSALIARLSLLIESIDAAGPVASTRDERRAPTPPDPCGCTTEPPSSP